MTNIYRTAPVITCNLYNKCATTAKNSYNVDSCSKRKYYYTTTSTPILRPLFQDNLGKPVPER